MTGRNACASESSPSSISSAVAAFVASWQKASAGVRMLIACQLRLSTSTMDLFNMSLIKSVAAVLDAHRASLQRRCLLFIEIVRSAQKNELGLPPNV